MDEDGDLDASGGGMIERGKRLCSEVPEDIVHQIVRALPPAAYCRFRSVSKGWKTLLSSEPDWMYWKRTGTPLSLVTTCGNHEIRAFSHGDDKCLSLPQNASLDEHIHSVLSKTDYSDRDSKIDWQLVDVDKAVFCCRAIVGDRVHFAVSNLIGGVLGSQYVDLDWDARAADFKVKLVVDPEKRNFKIIYAESSHLVVHESRNGGRYRVVYSNLPHVTDDFFVWKGVMYAYYKKYEEGDSFYELASEDIYEEGFWRKVPTRLPGGNAERLFVSDGDQLLLIRSHLGKRLFLEVWKLRDTAASRDHEPDFSLWMWENLRVGQKIAAIPEVRTRRLVDVCCGRGYMCFIFRAGPVEDAGEGVVNMTEPDICVKHSFVTGRSSVISCPTGWRTFARVFPWEPDGDVAFFEEVFDEESHDSDFDYGWFVHKQKLSQIVILDEFDGENSDEDSEEEIQDDDRDAEM